MSSSFLDATPSESNGEDSACQRVSAIVDLVSDSADFFNKLGQQGQAAISGLGDRFYSTNTAPEFVLSRNVPLPEELEHQIKNMRSQFSMGLFTEISRAWVVIDNDIFMWNYDTNDDLAYFDALQNTILKIALVRVKHDVFTNQVTYGLVVGTVADIYLYPVIIETVPGRSNPEISIDALHYFKVTLDNVTISDIVSLDNGRIFFSADDKLYEFIYENNTGWFGGGRKCRIVNHSFSLLAHIAPFLRSGSEEIEHIAVDKSRNILYCLCKNSTIQVWDLGVDGLQNVKITEISAGLLASEAAKMANGLQESAHFANIAVIIPLEAQQTNVLNLVAVTTKGVRIYFSVLHDNRVFLTNEGQTVALGKGVSLSDVRPGTLRVSHVRFTPGVAPHSIYRNSTDGVYTAYVDPYCSVMATLNRNLVFAYSNFYHPFDRTYYETLTELTVVGSVWAMTYASEKMLPELPTGVGMLPRVRIHPFLRQNREHNNRLVVCSNKGIQIFAQVLPLDRLRDALFDGGIEGRAVMNLWQQLGVQEMLVLALAILTSEAAVDERIKDKAATLFYSFKDGPVLMDNDRNLETNLTQEDSLADWQNRMRSPLQASTPRTELYHHDTSVNLFSSPQFNSPDNNLSFGIAGQGYRHTPSRRHDALYNYFARLIDPIWNHPICQVKNGNQLVTVLSSEEMEWLAGEVGHLGEVMEKYGLMPRNEVAAWNNSAVGKMTAEATNIERQSLLALRRLITACSETLMLWSTANSFNLEAISAGMDQRNLPAMASRKFHHIVTSNHSTNADLIKAMIKYFLGDEAGTKDLSEKLRSVCPTLYSKDDACVTNGMEMLKLATASGPGATRRELVQRACEMFKQSITKVALPAICQSLVELGAYEHMVELCILKAKKDDPKQLAMVAYKHGRGGVENKEMAEAERRRTECYKVMTDALDQLEIGATGRGAEAAAHATNRDVVINEVILTDDELAHSAVFRWMLDRSKSSMILEGKSPYVEQFLLHEVESGGQKCLDLLWRFYEKSGNFDKAATLLRRLAEKESNEIPLHRRVQYLSHAILCAQSSREAKTMSMIQDLRDHLEVAQIQMLIKEALDVRGASQHHRDAMDRLDKKIVCLQDLFVDYANPFKLYKIQLAIMKCANMYIEEKILAIWEDIIKNEFMYDGDVTERLLSTLGELYALYQGTSYFPLEYIIRRVLERGSGLGRSNPVVAPSSYVEIIKKLSLNVAQFMTLLQQEFRNGDPWWNHDKQGQAYMMDIAIAVVDWFLNTAHTYPINKRSTIIQACEMCLGAFSLAASSVTTNPEIVQLNKHITAMRTRLDALN